MRSFEETVLAFHRACAASGVGYALIGGVAVNAWGQHRTTADIHFLLALREERARAFADSLAAEGLTVNRLDLRSAFRDRTHVTVVDAAAGLHLDLKLALLPLEREQVDAAIVIEFEGGVVRVARPEDTVAFKLKFGSPQDWADARSILARQGKRLDEARLRRFASLLAVERDLARLREEVQGAG